MKHFTVFLLIFALFSASASVFGVEWTIMIFKNADNNLETCAVDDFLEIASVGSDASAEVNIVVMMDLYDGLGNSYGTWSEARRGLINSGDVPNNAWGESLGEQDMGNPAVLSGFITWAADTYPADKYALVVWNHGNGWDSDDFVKRTPPLYRAISYDDTSGNHLNALELRTALENGVAGSSNISTINLIGMDACLMGMMEIAYEIRGCGLVMTGSEKTEPGDGWPYDTVLDALVTTPTMTPAQLGELVVDEYGVSYLGEETQAAVDLTQMDTLAAELDTLAQTIVTEDSDWFAVYKARYASSWFTYDTYRDLGTFLNRLSTDGFAGTAVTQAAADAYTAYTAAVIDSHSGPGDGATGLSVYFTEYGAAVDSAYSVSNLSFVSDTSWRAMLQAFVGSDTSFSLPEGYELAWSTDFESNLPDGWTMVNGGEVGTTWSFLSASGSDPVLDGKYVCADSASSVMDEQLITQKIYCTDYDGVYLRFSHEICKTSGETCDVDVKVGSGSWQNVKSYTSSEQGAEYLDLTSFAARQSFIQVRWHFYNASSDGFWAVDTVEFWVLPRPAMTLAVSGPLDENSGVNTDVGTVTLNRTLETPVSVTLVSNYPGLVDFPVNPVVIPADTLECTFDIELLDDTDVNIECEVTVTATATDFVLADDTVTVCDEDEDADGMSDDWEEFYFLTTSESGIDDFDGDGADNLLEYTRGTDPTDETDYPPVFKKSSGGGGCSFHGSENGKGLIILAFFALCALFHARKTG